MQYACPMKRGRLFLFSRFVCPCGLPRNVPAGRWFGGCGLFSGGGMEECGIRFPIHDESMTNNRGVPGLDSGYGNGLRLAHMYY